MKLETLKKQLKSNFIIAGFLATSMILIIYFGFFFGSNEQTKINKLDGEIQDIKQQYDSLSSQIDSGKEFIKLLDSIPSPKKNLSGINLETAKQNLNDLKDRFFIKNLNSEFSERKIFEEESQNTKSLIPYFSQINLEFDAFNDVYAIQFIDEFVKSLSGYSNIIEFSVTKNGDYSPEDLIDISKNRAKPSTNVKTKIKWFDLSSEKKSDQSSNPANPDSGLAQSPAS